MSEINELKEAQKETQREIAKLTEAMHGLTIAFTEYCTRQDTHTEKLIDVNKRIEKLESSCNTRFEKQDDRLRVVEQACGVSSVWNDINKGKAVNIVSVLIAGLAVLYTIFGGQ